MRPLEPGQTIAHYRIVRPLGQGGQATAYLAEDRRLGRPVVLKTLRAERGGEEARRRLEREACLCSVLDHPNIAAIYDLGEADGIVYIAMQYAEGRTLKELLARGPLSLLSSLSIAIQVSDALSVAHAAGVVHRDIKPGNVIVNPGGQAKVLDFGLARAVAEEQDAEVGDALTKAGVPYGTLGYASPEQAAGDPADHRSDVFSLGVLIHEMVTGRRPFVGDTPIEVLRAVINEAPPPLASRCPDCPDGLQGIVDRALAKVPRDRYQTVAALRDDLKALMRRLSHETGVVPTEGSATLLPPRTMRTSWFGRAFGRLRAQAAAPMALPAESRAESVGAVHPAAADREKQKTLAVLPFRNLTGEPALDPLGLALVDGLVTSLATLDSLRVRPLSAVLRYSDRNVEPRHLGEALSVAWLLTGAFVSGPGKLRISAQLVAAEDGAVSWADHVDASRDDVPQAQDALAERVLAALRLHLVPQEAERAEPPATVNAQAYSHFLRGREMLGHFVQRTFDVDDLELAIRLFNEAVGVDPDFVAAHASLGRSYLLHAQGYGGHEYVHLGERSLRRALELQPSYAKARVQAAYVRVLDGDKAGARAACHELSLAMPHYPGVIELRAHLYRMDGHHADALGAYDRLAEASPSDAAVVAYKRARVLLAWGRYDEALVAAGSAYREAPHHAMVELVLALAWLHSGRPAAAANLLAQVLQRHPDFDGARPVLACCLAQQGDVEAARSLLGERVVEAARADPDTAFWLACALARQGDHAAAIEWLERSRRLGLDDRTLLEQSPHLVALHTEPAFAAILAGSERALRN